MSLLTDLSNICSELRSSKAPARNKAAEQLDAILSTSQSELLTLYHDRSTDAGEVSYATIFNSAVEATMQHAAKLEEQKGSKTSQAMRNKNYIFRSIVSKLVDYNLEADGIFLSKTVLLSAFVDGIETRSAYIHFSPVFLNILERGIYRSRKNVQDLKVNEYSRILSYMFQIRLEDIEGLMERLNMLRLLNTTIELAIQHVQINEDLISYVPHLLHYANDFKGDRFQVEIVRMFHLFISQLMVDYHYTICTELQTLLPVICGFYSFHMRIEIKELLFHSIYLYLHAIYPLIDNGETNNFEIDLHANWITTLHRVKSMVDMEIREQNQINSRSQLALADKCLEIFVKLSALIIYLFYWHVEANNNETSRQKIAKPGDKFETVMQFVHTDKTRFNQMWFAIVAELALRQANVINITNLPQLLKLSIDTLLINTNEQVLRNVCQCVTAALSYEQQFITERNMPAMHCHSQWMKLVDFLITENSTIAGIICEKQLILQVLIRHGKLNQEHCIALFNAYMANSIMKRTECIITVREILMRAELCSLDKTSDSVCRVLTWLNETQKLDARVVLHNIAPVEIALIADTSAVAVINFLNLTQVFKDARPLLPPLATTAAARTPLSYLKSGASTLQLLLYKYNQKLICLAEHGKEIQSLQTQDNINGRENNEKNCLFQTNYEVLMRLLNFETSQKLTCRDIACDLVLLLKMCTSLECLLTYGVLTLENFMQCPLIKRIGFFLSHLEYQMKCNIPAINTESELPYDILCEILHRLSVIISIFTRNPLLLQYTEAQPLDELIAFLSATLKISAAKQLKNGFENWSTISQGCLQVLAQLCASSTHFEDAFACIIDYRMDVTKDLAVLLKLIEIFCAQKSAHANVSDWFVDKLKTIFKLYYTNVETMEEVITLLPAIIIYVQEYDDSLQNMLIALNSLLKIALKKSYPTNLTAKLIDVIRCILKNCQCIFGQQNFTNICLSVTKFLTYPAFSIQCVTVNVLSALLDINWLHKSKRLPGVHLEFCQKLYNHINLSALPTNTTVDLVQNTKAVTMQMLTTIFTFSSYFRSRALEKLVFYCFQAKLTEGDFSGFSQIAAYNATNLKKLTLPYVDHLIDVWAMKLLPFTQFPYFLFGGTLDEFVEQNLSKIAIALLLHGKPKDIEALFRYKSKSELLKSSLPFARALILPYQAECEEAKELSYKRNIESLADNLKTLGIDLLNSHDKDAFIWETMYHVCTFVQDEVYFRELINFPLYYNDMQWFSLSANSLRSCLAYYVTGDAAKYTEFFTTLLSKGSVFLVHTVGYLKCNVVNCLNAIDALKHFVVFYTVMDILIDFIPPSGSKMKQALQNCIQFMMRDCLCFILQVGRKANEFNMQNTAIRFLQHFLTKPVILNGFCKSVVLTHLNDIFKSLILIADNATMLNIEEKALALMSSILASPDSEMLQAIPLLDEFPMTERFAELRQTQRAIQSSDGEKDMCAAITSFLGLNNRGIEGVKAMRHFLADNKAEMGLYNDLLYELIKRLIEIVRSSMNTDFSLEAAKCLGEIGSLKIESTSYYFQTDVNFYEDETTEIEPVPYFLQCVLVALEVSFITFKVESYVAACAVAEYVVNTEQAGNILSSFPFFSVFQTPEKKKKNFHVDIKDIDWLAALNDAEKFSVFDDWISRFVANILHNSRWQAFHDLATLDSSFANAILLPFIKLLLQNKELHLPNLLLMLEDFFSKFAKSLTVASSAMIYRDKRVISKILNICECVRIQNNWKVGLNLMHVVKACNYCQAYFMAIMYLELWAANERLASKEMSNQKIRNNADFQECGKKAYHSVGYDDAIAGFLDPLRSRLQFLELENNWSDILIEADTEKVISDGLCTDVLKRNGMLSVINNRRGSSIDFEVCWRLAQWDVAVEGHSKVDTLNDLDLEYEKHHYNALKCLYNREENNSLAALANARQCVLAILKDISVECLQSVYKYLTWLQMLQQVEDFCHIQFGTQVMIGNITTKTAAIIVSQIFKKWQAETELPFGNFRCKELVLSHQIALLRTAGVRTNRKITALYQNNPITLCSLTYIRACKAAGEMNLAKRNMAMLRKMPITCVHVKANILLEDADLCLRSGHSLITRSILQNLLRSAETMKCPEYLSALHMYGEYLLETNTENFETVLRKYLHPSIEKLSQYENMATTSEAFRLETFSNFEKKMKKNIYEVIAKYADREYIQLDAFVKSDGFQMKRCIIEKNRNAANAIKLGGEKRDDKLCGAIQMKRFANLDEKELKFTEMKCSENLGIAIENYLRLCTIDESASTAAIYRIIALWFANRSNNELHTKLNAVINEVPSYKFICALNQITAQLNTSNERFLEVLQALLVRCTEDHPHHTLYHLYSLVFAHNDTLSKGTAVVTTTSVVVNNENNRVKIAKSIINQASNQRNAECIQQMECMLPALIHFANLDVQKSKTNISDALRRLKNLNAVHCPTVQLPVSASKKYNVISISRWDDNITLVGGLNAPKKLICLCSDGRRRPQLLKGRDDMRQDAVMQQVFTSINEMLAKEPAAVERKLLLRTYKVIPLSMRSGILEWCENGIPIGVYLGASGKDCSGAHQRYHPTELTPYKCRLLAMHNLKSDLAKRHEVYQQICSRLTPVLHYFLLEKFLVPGIWFERRLAYTNSVATTSMVGYIIGLGDRHAQNILIDEKSAEVIHIDFGIAFEQGKIMPTPETVPFRLTRDIVAPMGVCETSGVFKRSCETTMDVLRRNQAVIITILEVLLYDPLYMWNVVPQLSDISDCENANTMARRALLTIQNKLEGKQAGVLGNSDVSAQVQRLINEATSTINLCQLYPGWDPYL